MKRVNLIPMRVIFMSFFLAFSSYVAHASFPIYPNDINIDTKSEKCDNIILINGEEIPSKIIEITPKLIKYKRCDYQEGPLISILKSKVLMIRYQNGSKEIFSDEIKPPINNNKETFSNEDNPPRRSNFLNIAGAIHFIIGVIGIAIASSEGHSYITDVDFIISLTSFWIGIILSIMGEFHYIMRSKQYSEILILE